MIAARYATYGAPSEVLEVRADVAVPGQGGLREDEVLVRVEAAALNAADHKGMAGFYQRTQKRELPVTPASEVSGTVVDAGDGAAAQALLGREVWADLTGLDGAFAQYAAAPASVVGLKPASLGHAQAAALPVAGSTSLQALRQVGLSPGESVLLLGGATGCGAAGIQIAKALGAATVCTTAAAGSHEADVLSYLARSELSAARTGRSPMRSDGVMALIFTAPTYLDDLYLKIATIDANRSCVVPR